MGHGAYVIHGGRTMLKSSRYFLSLLPAIPLIWGSSYSLEFTLRLYTLTDISRSTGSPQRSTPISSLPSLLTKNFASGPKTRPSPLSLGVDSLAPAPSSSSAPLHAHPSSLSPSNTRPNYGPLISRSSTALRPSQFMRMMNRKT
jgi:hypothetical protein